MATSTLTSSMVTNNGGLSFSKAVSGERTIFSSTNKECLMTRPRVITRAATQPGGTRRAQVVQVGGDKSGKLRLKNEGGSSVKLLSRIQQLRLLSKVEKAGLLSTAEKLGFSLSNIESLGLLSKAESLGVLSAATNKDTPAQLLGLAVALLAAGPGLVYLTPDDNTLEVVAQCAGAAVFVIAGAALFAISDLVSTLQKDV